MAQEIEVRTTSIPETEPNQTDELFQKLHEYYSQTLPEQGFKQDDDPNMWENPASRQGLYIISTKDSLAIEWHEKDEQKRVKAAYKLIYIPDQNLFALYDTSDPTDEGIELWSLDNINPKDFEYIINAGLLSPEFIVATSPQTLKTIIEAVIEAENHPTTRNKAKARMLLTASRIPGARHLINWWSKHKSS